MSSAAPSPVLTVGKRLVELCSQGKFHDAITELYSPNIVSVEAGAPPGKSAEVQGLAAVLGKAQWWAENHEVHGSTTKGPFPHGDRFAVYFTMDVTSKVGPYAGKRMTIEEVALYTVAGGKIVREEFFYSM